MAELLTASGNEVLATRKPSFSKLAVTRERSASLACILAEVSANDVSSPDPMAGAYGIKFRSILVPPGVIESIRTGVGFEPSLPSHGGSNKLQMACRNLNCLASSKVSISMSRGNDSM